VSSAVEGIDAAAGDAAGQPNGTWSVSGLAAAVGETIQRAFPSEVWVRGEIIGYSPAASGHIYFNLIEPGTGNDRRGARMRVALFKGRQRGVNRDLAAAGGLTLDDGIEVRIRAEVTRRWERKGRRFVTIESTARAVSSDEVCAIVRITAIWPK